MKIGNGRKWIALVVSAVLAAGSIFPAFAGEAITETVKDLPTEKETEKTAGTANEIQSEVLPEIETTTEAATEAATEALEEPGGDPVDPNQDGGESADILTGVSMESDRDGDYYTYSINQSVDAISLTVRLLDSAGSQIGGTLALPTVTGSVIRKAYILSFAEGNIFGVTDGDIGKSVHVEITADPGEGKEPQVVSSGSSVVLRYPTMSMPSVISYTAASVAGDLLDVSKISGLSFDTGSFGVRRVVEKLTDGAWSALPDGDAITAASEGTYRIRIQTVLGDFFSNEFQIVVPLTGVSVEGEQRIGKTLTALPQGPDGKVPGKVTYAWTYAGAASPISTEASYTPSLQDAVNAQAVSMTLSVTDMIGNVYSSIVNLAPLDLSTVTLTAQGYDELIYNEESQIPYDAQILVDGFVIPSTLYTIAEAEGKNTMDAGKAWMSVTGREPYLTGTGLAQFRISKEELEIDEEDLILTFAYDGKPHQPVLKFNSESAGKMIYKNWQRRAGDGSWQDMSGAPADPGTYRVDLTIKSADGNYLAASFEALEFTITAPAPAPAAPAPAQSAPKPKQAADLTVTDAAGNAAAYQSKTVTLPAAEGQEPEKVYEISAQPAKNSDGSVLTDQDGKPVYHQRNLHVTPDLRTKMQSSGAGVIRFVLGDAALQISAAALDAAAAYTVRLAVLSGEDLTEGEKNTLAEYGDGMKTYAMRIVRESDGEDVTEAVAAGGGLEVLVKTQGQESGRILFLKEKRDEAPASPVPYVADGKALTQDGVTYLKRTAPGTGIFGLL